MSGEQINNMNHKDAREVIDRLQDCFDACKRMKDPVGTLNEVRNSLDDLFYVMKGYQSPDINSVLTHLKAIREDLGDE